MRKLSKRSTKKWFVKKQRSSQRKKLKLNRKWLNIYKQSESRTKRSYQNYNWENQWLRYLELQKHWKLSLSATTEWTLENMDIVRNKCTRTSYSFLGAQPQKQSKQIQIWSTRLWMQWIPDLVQKLLLWRYQMFLKTSHHETQSSKWQLVTRFSLWNSSMTTRL